MSAREYWDNELRVLTESTRDNYRHCLGIFLDYLGVDHEGVYVMQKECLEDGDRRVVLRLCRCLQDMVDEGYSGGYVHIIATAVRKFMMLTG